LVGECERDKCGTVKVVLGGFRSEDASMANIYGDILEPEDRVVGSWSRVFAGTAQEEESNTNNVNDRNCFLLIMLPCKIGSMVDDGDRNRFDMVRRGVGLRVAAELTC
jgi:hypothetical protein